MTSHQRPILVLSKDSSRCSRITDQYVLLPVHVATSAVWLGGFYLALKSGVDIAGLLERLGTSDWILDYLRHSEAGYIALSYACYKIATPARYAVTVGGTTLGQFRAM